MYFNKLREYIVSDECLIRHGKDVCNDGVDDQFDLLEGDAKVDEDISSKIKRLTNFLRNKRKNEPNKPPTVDPPKPLIEVDVKTKAVEDVDFPDTKRDNNPPEECSGKQKNEDYEKKKDAEPTGEKYEQTPEGEASEQQYRKAGTQCDMPDIENEKIRDVMEKIRIFEEKIDKVRKMKFIKKY